MATVWIDLDNAPHVPFFAPIIDGLNERGHRTLITIRDYGYTASLADRHGLSYELVGTHPGANKVRKVIGLAGRAMQLASWSRGRDIDVSISHGSRGLVLASRMARIPTITMYDYEFVFTSILNRLSQRVLLPNMLPDELVESMGIPAGRAVKYPGMKEEVYLGRFLPDRTLLEQLGANGDQTLIVIRPPATTAHYHNALSEDILRAFFERVTADTSALGVIVPRTAQQARELDAAVDGIANIRVLHEAVDGLNLIWHADMVVGGGGTMNREAALLGVPVYSVFTGRVGAIDDALSKQGKLTFVRSVEDVAAIDIRRRVRPDPGEQIEAWKRRSAELVAFIATHIEQVAG